ncbi:MAG: M23 family metallopeptidase [Hydrogenophilus sp.]|nr:M23 family metallopeptidase [Hydrogenophilus sp.]
MGLSACASVVKSPVVDRSPTLPSSQSPAAQPAAPPQPTAAIPEFHRVAPGETLSQIARRYGLTSETLAQLNGISDPNRIFVGQQLRLRPGTGGESSGVQVIPVGESPPPPPASAEVPRGGRVGGGTSTAALSPQGGGASSDPSTPPSATTGTQWVWPAHGAILTKFDGNQHKGIDIGGKVGDPVMAAADGKVSYVGEGIEGFGLMVILQHPGDFVSVYAHNQKTNVKEGDTVKRGQVIAQMGQTGNADRPKLHFQIRRAGKALDPETLLPKR